MNILTDYPTWFLILCPAAGLLFALALYYRERRSEFPASAKGLMLFLRFATVSLIAFLLLSPLFKMQVQMEDKPRLLIFQDVSSSVVNGPDSLYYQNEYPAKMKELIEHVSDKYEAVRYYFSEGVTVQDEFPGYTGVRTDIASVFRFVEDRYSNRNVGAVILASDGIYNSGMNPAYANRNFKYPLFTLALGDTVKVPDIRINKVNFNEIAFLGNDFPVEVNLHADKSEGSAIDLTIRKGEKVVAQEKLTIDNPIYNKNFRFLLKAEKPGVQQYVIEATRLDHELNKSNNRREIYVEVIDTRQKILLLYNSPHPDIAALRSVLEKNKQYEVDVVSLDNFNKSIEQYNLLIYHQLPSREISSVKLREQTSASDIPVLYILGSQTDISYFNNMSAGLQISSAVDFEDAYPDYNSNFSLFSISESLRNSINQWPPLQVYFGNYLLSNSAYVLLDQRIGSMVTDKPLMLLNAPVEEKSAVIAGEGIWRWRMMDHTLNGNQNNFEELIGKTVRYLSLQADKKQFRVTTDRIYDEFEEVELYAYLYNENYEPVNSPEVNLVITNQQGKEFPYVMGRMDEAYHLNAGNFPVGLYSFKASVIWNSKELSDAGEFRVRDSNLEDLQLAADHNLLYRLARMHDGEMFYPSQFEEMENTLMDSAATSVVSYKQEYAELLNLKWLLAVLVFLLALEWFMRKWNGSY